MIDVEKIIREYIDKTVHMSLATVSGNKPWVCEVHFAYDDNLNLYWSSLGSSRHSKELKSNPQVAGNIVRQHDLGELPAGIYFEGEARLLQTDEEKQRAFECMKQHLGLNDQDLEDTKDPNRYQFYQATVENWYAFGKFGEDVMQKYELKWNGGEK